MPYSRLSFRALFSISALACLLGCLGGEQEAPPTPSNGATNPNGITGVCLFENGSPASRASVFFFPVDFDHVNDLAWKVSRSETDEQGRFRMDGLRPGLYSMVAYRDSGSVRYGAFRDSLTFLGGKRELAPETLRPAGTIVGRIRIPPGEDPNLFSVSLLGTDWNFKPDRDGVFESPALPAGAYRIAVRKAADDFYAADSGSLRVRAGSKDTLPDTLAPRYVGPPVLSGIAADYDTATGVMRLRWPKASWGRLALYEVFRRRILPSPEDAAIRIGFPTDTVFRDTLLHLDAGSWFARELPYPDSAAFRFRYEIAIADSAGRIGPKSAPLEAEALSPFFIRTKFQFDVTNLTWRKAAGNASPDDSIRIWAKASNPTRLLSRVQWFRGDTIGKPILDTLFPHPQREGHLELRLKAPSHGDTQLVWTLRAWDGGGWNYPGTAAVTIHPDRPSASAGSDTDVEIGKRVALHGIGTDGIGEIVKREWDIGGTGFREVSGPDTSFDAPSLPGKVACVFRVTDEDGNQALDTMVVNALDPIDLMPAIGFQDVAPNLLFAHIEGGLMGHRCLAFGGKLWLLGGLSARSGSENLSTVLFSADGKAWKEMDLDSTFPLRIGHGAVVFKDRMWVLGGRFRTALDSSLPKDQRVYRWKASAEAWSSSDGKIWRRETASGFPELDGFAAAVFGGRIWVLGGKDANQQPGNGVWSSEDGITWTESSAPTPLGRLAGMAAVAYHGSLYAMGGSEIGGFGLSHAIWKSEDGLTWTRWVENAPFDATYGMEAVEFQDRIWVVGGARDVYHFPESPGGLSDSLANKAVWRSPDGRRWRSDAAPKALRRNGPSLTVFGNALWILFGSAGSVFAANGMTAE